MNRCSKKKKIKIIPYGICEFIYWIFKIFAMPTVGALFILLIIIWGFLGNPILTGSPVIIMIFASALIASYIRERLRAFKYRIKTGLIKNQCLILNKIKESTFEIGFVGDIMRMKNILRKYHLNFSPSVKFFFKNVNLLIGNLEGVITSKNGIFIRQGFQNKIIKELENLLINQNTKWLLCLSNNHSADFGFLGFNQSFSKVIQNPNFSVFGRKDIPNLLLKNGINIASASEWSNKDYWEYISRYSNDELRKYYRHGNFNILYPHWGYENERYARARIQKDAKALLTGNTMKYSRYQESIRNCYCKRILPSRCKWDLIFGHHSHVRQPIMQIIDDNASNNNPREVKKLVVFSGGNFTSGALIIRKRKHTRGIILRCKIGPLIDCPTKLGIGRVTWRYTIIRSKRGNRKTRRVYVVKAKEKLYRFLILGLLLFTFGKIVLIILLFMVC